MKRIITICLFLFSGFGFSQSQEWMTSLDVAKSLAFVQDKLLFVVWEDVYYEQYPVMVKNSNGKQLIIDLFADELITNAIWEHFIPVVLSEQKYEALYNEIKGKRNDTYIEKFNDDTIKIMDVNGNIINTTPSYYDFLDIEKFIGKYALKTTFLKGELSNYRAQKDENTAYQLASKYIDFAVLVPKDVRKEILKMSEYYLSEAAHFSGEEPPEIFKQRLELQRLKQSLVLGRPKRVLRQLKRMDTAEVDVTNQEILAFLYYTSYALLNDEEKAGLWKTKVSLVNLKKANLILNIHS